MDGLTREAKKLLGLMYGEYLYGRNEGKSKSAARYFGGVELIKQRLLPNESESDIADTCRELSRSGIISACYSDNSPGRIVLTDKGIVLMEERFAGIISDVLKFLKDLRAIIPIHWI